MHSEGELVNVHLQERLTVLKRRVVEHRDRYCARCETEDKVEKWTKDWIKQNDQSAEVNEKRLKKLEHQREIAAEQRAVGIKKKNGVRRCVGGKEKYLATAAGIYALLQGKEQVWWNKIAALFDELLIKANENGSLGSHKVVFMPGKDGKRGMPRYLKYAYPKAVEGILKQNMDRKTMWYVVAYTEEGAAAAIKNAAEITVKEGCLIQHVVDICYPTASQSDPTASQSDD